MTLTTQQLMEGFEYHQKMLDMHVKRAERIAEYTPTHVPTLGMLLLCYEAHMIEYHDKMARSADEMMGGY